MKKKFKKKSKEIKQGEKLLSDVASGKYKNKDKLPFDDIYDLYEEVYKKSHESTSALITGKFENILRTLKEIKNITNLKVEIIADRSSKLDDIIKRMEKIQETAGKAVPIKWRCIPLDTVKKHEFKVYINPREV